MSSSLSSTLANLLVLCGMTALIAYRDGKAADAATLKLAQESWSVHEHMPSILAGTKPLVIPRSDYITIGGADETTVYVREYGLIGGYARCLYFADQCRCRPAEEPTPRQSNALMWLNVQF
jgi:hypothetical protein